MEVLPERLIGEICFMPFDIWTTPPAFQSSSQESGHAAFRHCNRHSAVEDLVIWRNNYDRKARTNNYLGLSSDSDASFQKVVSEYCWEGELLGLQVLRGAREASWPRMIGRYPVVLVGVKGVFGAAIRLRSCC